MIIVQSSRAILLVYTARSLLIVMAWRGQRPLVFMSALTPPSSGNVLDYSLASSGNGDAKLAL